MSVLAVGLSHRSSPVALLERVALNGEARAKAVGEMLASDSVNEVMVLSTCNRTEIYADVSTYHGGVAAVTELLSWHTGVPLGELSEHVYVHYEDSAVQHLFSVTCGLDSMVVGEGQILGQVRDALKEGQKNGSVGRVLNDLGQRALHVGKRAHTETHLDHAGADMVGFGLDIAVQNLATAPGASIPGPPRQQGHAPAGADVRYGGAELHGPARGLARGLAARNRAAHRNPGPDPGRRLHERTVGPHRPPGAGRVVVANRTFERAARLAECLTEAYDSLQAEAVAFEEATDVLAGVDLVISCTGAQGFVLTAEQVAAKTRGRTRPLVFLDLALPRDIDPKTREIDHVSVVDIEDLRQASRDTEQTDHAGALTLVRDIVDEEVSQFRATRRANQVTPTVVALRTQGQGVVDSELSRLLGRLPDDLDDRSREEIGRAMRRVADKLLHRPTVRVKELAVEPDGHAYEAALRELFDLDPNPADASTASDRTSTAAIAAQEKA